MHYEHINADSKARRPGIFAWLFLVALAGLLGWSLVLFQTEGEYSYRRWTSLIVPTMLILNHLAFNIVHKKPWSILLKIAAGVFLAFGCFILFSGR